MLTRDFFLRLFLLDPGGLLEQGQGVLLLLEGGLSVTRCRFLLLEGFALLLEGHGRLLALELGLLALELGLLALELGLLTLELGLLLLERCPNTQQLGSLRLGLLSLLLRRGPLDVALAGVPCQLLL